jgi:hypothetical protein
MSDDSWKPDEADRDDPILRLLDQIISRQDSMLKQLTEQTHLLQAQIGATTILILLVTGLFLFVAMK